MFAYDQTNKQIKEVANPSDATWDEIDYSWDELDYAPKDFTPSPHYKEIQDIIGKENRKDVLHIDSAFKSGSKCMFTRDDHFLSDGKKDKLESLLNIKLFDAVKDKDKFMEFLKYYEQHENS